MKKNKSQYTKQYYIGQEYDDRRWCDFYYKEQIRGWIASGMRKRKTSYSKDDPKRFS